MNYRWQRLCLGLLIVLMAILFIGTNALPGRAHWADLSTAEIHVSDTNVRVTLTLPTEWVNFADDNGDQILARNELQAHEDTLVQFLGDRIYLTQPSTSTERSLVNRPTLEIPDPGLDSGPLTGATPAPSTPATHSTVILNFQRTAPLDELALSYTLFPEGDATAQSLATITQNGRSRHVVLTPDQPTVALSQSSRITQVGQFLMLGIEHMLTGYDHVLFLLSLLIVSSRLSEIIKIVTAFTVAHSISLALATFNLVRLPGPWVESAIALSLIYVAAENLVRKEMRQRWILTCAFGFIHGFGFAGLLQELNPSTSNLALVLASFNIGIELGQVVIVAIAFFILNALRKTTWDQRIRQFLCWSMIGLGSVWLYERLSLIH